MSVNTYNLLPGNFKRISGRTKKKAKFFANYKINIQIYKVVFSCSTHNRKCHREQRKDHVNNSYQKTQQEVGPMNKAIKCL